MKNEEKSEGIGQQNCAHCGGTFFDVRYTLLKISAFHPENPSGEDQIHPNPVYVCMACKNIVKHKDISMSAEEHEASVAKWRSENIKGEGTESEAPKKPVLVKTSTIKASKKLDD